MPFVSTNPIAADMKKYTLLQKYKMMRKYKKYSNMKKQGKSDREIYVAAKFDGLDAIERLEILWNICGLSIGDAKELMLCTNSGTKSLSEYQEKYTLPALKKAFEEEAREIKKSKEGENNDAASR